MPDLTTRLAGETIELIGKTDDTLIIRCESGIECHIAWKEEGGRRALGEPRVVWYGKKVMAKTAHLAVFGRAINGS